MLLSYSNNWIVKIDHLAAASDKDGRAAVMSALNELQEHEYMTMRRVRNEIAGQFADWEKVVRETPIPQDEAISTNVRKSNVGRKARKTSLATEVGKSDVGETKVGKSNVGETEERFSDVGDAEVRKTALRESRNLDKPQDGKSDCIINNDRNKYLVKEVSISPLTPQAELERVGQLEQLEQVGLVEQVRLVEQVEQLEICFS